MSWEDYRECRNYTYIFTIIYMFHLELITPEMKMYFSDCCDNMRYYEWEHGWE